MLAAAAIKTLGGQILCRFALKDEKDAEALSKLGILDVRKIYTTEDLARGNQLTFTATGVIDGPLLPGIVVKGHSIITHSVVMRASSGTIRYITTHHHVK